MTPRDYSKYNVKEIQEYIDMNVKAVIGDYMICPICRVAVNKTTPNRIACGNHSCNNVLYALRQKGYIAKVNYKTGEKNG
jgi:hypothetical protein